MEIRSESNILRIVNPAAAAEVALEAEEEALVIAVAEDILAEEVEEAAVAHMVVAVMADSDQDLREDTADLEEAAAVDHHMEAHLEAAADMVAAAVAEEVMEGTGGEMIGTEVDLLMVGAEEEEAVAAVGIDIAADQEDLVPHMAAEEATEADRPLGHRVEEEAEAAGMMIKSSRTSITIFMSPAIILRRNCDLLDCQDVFET